MKKKQIKIKWDVKNYCPHPLQIKAEVMKKHPELFVSEDKDKE